MLFPFKLCIEYHSQVFGCICIWNFLHVDFNSYPVYFPIWFICVDFVSLSFILPLFVQLFTMFAALCSLLVDSLMLSPVARIAVSSANVAILTSVVLGTSLVYSRNKTGPKTLPCGTPAYIFFISEYSSSYFTRKYLSAI